MLYNILKCIIGFLFKIFFKVKVHGRENIPSETGFILCSNHSSNFDPLMISCFFPHQINWMGKKELFENKLLGRFLTKLGAFPVDREQTDMKSIKNSLKILKSKGVLGIFPEGTRVEKLDLSNAKAGVSLLSVRSRSSILPVYIKSNYKIFNRVDIYYGEVIDFSKDLDGIDEKPSTKDYLNMSKRLLETIYSLEKS